MRIATWNIERPGARSVARLPGIHARLRDVRADVWVLTETNVEAIDLRDSHPHLLSTPAVEGYHTGGHRWTSIHSRWPMVPLDVSTPNVAIAARVDAPTGSVIVYGTVLPYHADQQHLGRKRWQEYFDVLPRQAGDWRRLRDAHPDVRFCVAGDLNQSLDQKRWPQHGKWYGTEATRSALTDALGAAGLRCVTDGELVDMGLLHSRSTIDHVCLDLAWAEAGYSVGAWEAGRNDGVELSDHNGV